MGRPGSVGPIVRTCQLKWCRATVLARVRYHLMRRTRLPVDYHADAVSGISRQ